jgi:hypothetical protein
MEFTKRERAQLRELAGDTYEAELGTLLGELAHSFDDWRAGKLLSSELSQAIHDFHQGESRRLWSMYQTLKEHDIVAHGIALGVLSEDRVSLGLRRKLDSFIGRFRER